QLCHGTFLTEHGPITADNDYVLKEPTHPNQAAQCIQAMVTRLPICIGKMLILDHHCQCDAFSQEMPKPYCCLQFPRPVSANQFLHFIIRSRITVGSTCSDLDKRHKASIRLHKIITEIDVG